MALHTLLRARAPVALGRPVIASSRQYARCLSTTPARRSDDDLNKISRTITQPKSQGASQAMLYATGLEKEDMSKAQVGISSVWWEGNPCNMHLLDLSAVVKKSVARAGLVPYRFNTIGVSDGISMGTTGMRYSLQSREIIADSIETVMQGQWYDANISLPGCDKNMPGVLIAMGRVNRPSIMVYGGTIKPGCTMDGKTTDIVSAFQAYGQYISGEISEEQRFDIIRHACNGSGACGGMYTANTMASKLSFWLALASNRAFDKARPTYVQEMEASKQLSSNSQSNNAQAVYSEIPPRESQKERRQVYLLIGTYFRIDPLLSFSSKNRPGYYYPTYLPGSMSDHDAHANAPSHDDGSHGTHNKHVHYEVDTHSLASDDDMRELEVTFDPTSPYRRKSSLVPNDHLHTHITNQHMKKPFSSDCLVHQLLESHKTGGLSHHTAAKREDVSHELGLNSYVEPKGNSERRRKTSERLSLIESESDDSSASGQIDEQSWKTEVVKSRSELDLVGQEHESIHSRLLTKKQLTEMAWGVRELSRRLGMVRLKFRVENIFLLTKVYDEDLIPKTRELAKWLLSKDRDTRYTIYIQDILKESKLFDMAGLIQEIRSEYIEAGELDQDTPIEVISRRIRFWTEDMCRRRPHTFDFILTLGGDGTVLYASWLFQRIVPPVLSFALGSLGFLTKFDFNEYQESLNTAFTAGVTVSLRLRFEGTVMRSQTRKILLGSDQDVNGDSSSLKRDLVEELIGEEKDDDHTHKPDGTYEILNEIVVDRGPNPSK
ncbi:hypothetical protein O1611_g7354 [Lasiodiplodia mahajangana]|uniref:Uncharacterized protein n=1 Tax=Lasiodiplodia mahajangana TaxID=1108764 RepID=A0ACC2JG12_9PEZI|nr:hypothetical protein O1611_g7354 [Lasiodiplodia mahajangana]